jgi:chromosome segregation ATPase
MADRRNLDIRKVIADNAKVSDVANLAQSGVKKVKVLDEAGLQRMIEQAVDAVIQNTTAEERSRILADSRKQLTKLMNERDQVAKNAKLAEAGRNDLLREIEKLQKEVDLRRDMQEQEAALARKAEELANDNAFLRENNDKIVAELEQAQARVRELEAEVERLKARIAELEAELEEAEATRATADTPEKQEERRLRRELAKV